MSFSNRAKKTIIGITVQLVAAGLFLGWIYYLKQTSPNRDDAKLEEIKVELAKLPVYPDFQKVGEHFTSRHMDASASLYFLSRADVGRVRMSVFLKNDLSLVIEYHPDQDDWNYALGIDWKNPEK